MTKIVSALFLLTYSLSLLAATVSYPEGELQTRNVVFTESTNQQLFGNYLLYVPKSLPSNIKERRILVMLHGCMQLGNEFFEGTGIRQYADQMGFLVVLPQQSPEVNPYHCWNWVLPSNQVKSMGMVANEPRLILEAIDQVRAKYGIASNDRVFMAGMSAGAAMANIIASCYPKRVRAIALSQGVQYTAAAFTWWDIEGLKKLGTDGSTVDPEFTGLAAASCAMMGEVFPYMMMGTTVPSIIFHGDSDVMTYDHALQIEKQFLVAFDYLDNGFRDGSLKLKSQSYSFPASDDNILAYDLERTTQGNSVLIDRYKIYGLGHAWSGGDDAYGHFDHRGPNATKLMIDFFKQFDF